MCVCLFTWPLQIWRPNFAELSNDSSRSRRGELRTPSSAQRTVASSGVWRRRRERKVWVCASGAASSRFWRACAKTWRAKTKTKCSASGVWYGNGKINQSGRKGRNAPRSAGSTWNKCCSVLQVFFRIIVDSVSVIFLFMILSRSYFF